MISMSKEDAKKVMKALDDFDGWADHGCPPSTAVALKIMREAIAAQPASDCKETGVCVQTGLACFGQAAQPAPVQDVDWKDMYEKEKRRSAMWIAKYEKDIGPLEYAVPVAEPAA